MATQETLDEIDIKLLKLLQQKLATYDKGIGGKGAFVTVAHIRATEAFGA